MTGRIHLSNMAFYGYHGDRPEEATQGQRFLVDLVLTLDITEAAAHDRLSATVDYVTVYSLCRGILENERVRLLETLCRRIIDVILKEFDRVVQVDIVIKKPSAPIPGVLDYVAVEATGGRADRLSGTGK